MASVAGALIVATAIVYVSWPLFARRRGAPPAGADDPATEREGAARQAAAEILYCTHCGAARAAADAMFCSTCGSRLEPGLP